jgi:hypothetical protein
VFSVEDTVSESTEKIDNGNKRKARIIFNFENRTFILEKNGLILSKYFIFKIM